MGKANGQQKFSHEIFLKFFFFFLIFLRAQTAHSTPRLTVPGERAWTLPQRRNVQLHNGLRPDQPPVSRGNRAEPGGKPLGDCARLWSNLSHISPRSHPERGSNRRTQRWKASGITTTPHSAIFRKAQKCSDVRHADLLKNRIGDCCRYGLRGHTFEHKKWEVTKRLWENPHGRAWVEIPGNFVLSVLHEAWKKDGAS